MSKESTSKHYEEKEVATYRTNESRRFGMMGVFTFNIGSIGTLFWRSTVVFIGLLLIDVLIVRNLTGQSLFTSVAAFLGITELGVALVSQFTFERVVFFIVTGVLVFTVVWWLYPGLPVMKFYECDWDRRLLDVTEVPITHRVGGSAFCGGRQIVLKGESPHFMTFAGDGSKSVMVDRVHVTGDRITGFLTDAYTLSPHQILAVADALERFTEDYSKTLRECISWRANFASEVQVAAAKMWNQAAKKLDPKADFRVVKLPSRSVKLMIPSEEYLKSGEEVESVEQEDQGTA